MRSQAGEGRRRQAERRGRLAAGGLLAALLLSGLAGLLGAQLVRWAVAPAFRAEPLPAVSTAPALVALGDGSAGAGSAASPRPPALRHHQATRSPSPGPGEPSGERREDGAPQEGPEREE
ncbi:MAG: hypothetical protein K6U79_04930 [Firmicutes bacterium]|nr:hypothetical protein [Bacillota bacterium]